MKELLKESPLRAVITVAYLTFAALYLCYGFLPASADSDSISGRLNLPTAGIAEDVTPSRLDGRDLYVPDYIVSAYSSHPRKTLLMGHSTSAFRDLPSARIGDIIFYAGHRYRIIDRTEVPVENIDMTTLLSAAPTDTLILMTCAGTPVGDTYPARLIITATAL